MRAMQKVGIFGGGFDPVHRGHISVAKEAISLLNLDKVIFVPLYQSPFEVRTYEDEYYRYNLAVKALLKFKKLEVSDIEITRASNRYVMETVEFCSIYEDDLYVIVGYDEFLELGKWKDFETLLKLVTLVVFKRDVSGIRDLPRYYTKWRSKTIIVDNDLIDISSSEIRHKVKAGESISKLVPRRIEKSVKEAYSQEGR